MAGRAPESVPPAEALENDLLPSELNVGLQPRIQTEPPETPSANGSPRAELRRSKFMSIRQVIQAVQLRSCRRLLVPNLRRRARQVRLQFNRCEDGAIVVKS
jgi:hypothetical protein